MKIRILSEKLAKVHGRKAGDEIKVEDVNGVPKDRYWRNRIIDAKIDGCVEVVVVKTTKKEK